MTNKEKALALIGPFATGNTEMAASLLAEGYIQHNLLTEQAVMPLWAVLLILLLHR